MSTVNTRLSWKAEVGSTMARPVTWLPGLPRWRRQSGSLLVGGVPFGDQRGDLAALVAARESRDSRAIQRRVSPDQEVNQLLLPL